MRADIVHPGADKLRYEIREIVAVAKRVAQAGIPIIWATQSPRVRRRPRG